MSKFLSNLNKKQKRWGRRILQALAIYVVVVMLDHLGLVGALVGKAAEKWVLLALYLVPYLYAGGDVLKKAYNNIREGQVFDESFLMSVATLGALATVFFPDTEPQLAEGAAVMLFYQVGEFFQSYAVGKSRKSIAAMMDIAPDYANVERDGRVVEVDPGEVEPGSVIVIKPGERVPLDGRVVEGASQLDTAALTGESVPRVVAAGADVISGCINMTGVLRVRTTKAYGESTVSRILELVENASEKKARTENFITRFARVYTPIVVLLAVALAIIPPVAGMGPWTMWVMRALTFLVVSCPCALVVSVPLSFFGGIGGASRMGVLVKGSNYLEALSKVDTVVFDKTGTLTNGTFNVVAVHTEQGLSPDYVLSLAAHAESFSNHPIAVSIREAWSGKIDEKRVADVAEESGHRIVAHVDEHVVMVGNDKLMGAHHTSWHDCELTGTILHVAVDGAYAGHIVIADVVKNDAAQAIADLKASGIRRCVMLTGDRTEVAEAVAKQLGIDEVHAQLLPQDKVGIVESLLLAEPEGGRLAFVGDGINDAPVLTRADVGIAMGAMGSDAAIEAADVVLMDDHPTSIARAIRHARKTLRVVWENITFALVVKVAILVLAALGLANMWLAVFGDVGVTCLAVLNAMRAMRIDR